MNVIAQLEYELAYYNPAVLCFKHYTMRPPPFGVGDKNLWVRCALRFEVLTLDRLDLIIHIERKIIFLFLKAIEHGGKQTH